MRKETCKKPKNEVRRKRGVRVGVVERMSKKRKGAFELKKINVQLKRVAAMFLSSPFNVHVHGQSLQTPCLVGISCITSSQPN